MDEKNELINMSVVPTIVFLKRENESTFIVSDNERNSYIINKSEEFIKTYLKNTDNIVSTYSNKSFLITERILDIQRYIHNELSIPYKDILDIEIVYTEKKEMESQNIISTNRYPCENQPSFDFKSTILDTCNKCEVVYNNIDKMYYLVLVSDVQRTFISELINRYLFIDTYDSRGLQRRNISSFFNYDLNSHDNNISQRMYNLERQREYEVNNFRNIINNQLPINNENVYPRNMTFGFEGGNNYYFQYNFDYTPDNRFNGMFDNMIQLLNFVNQINVDNEDLEPVRVTIDKNKINLFLTNFLFNPENDKLQVKNQTSCAICITDYEKDENVSAVKNCGHLFHSICINKWICEFNHKCPVCRSSVDPEKNT